jgi:hypothetical protein
MNKRLDEKRLDFLPLQGIKRLYLDSSVCGQAFVLDVLSQNMHVILL